MSLLLFVIPVVALVVGLIIWQVIAMQKRREALAQWAATHGCTFVAKDRQLEQTYRGFTPFGRGSGRMCRNIIEGEHRGLRFRVFRYQYTVQHGKNSSTYVHHILAIRTPIAAPDLDIKREHVGHKLFDALGGEDIDFESDAFSRRFWVKSRDRRFAYDVIHPGMQEWLMANGERHWQWRGDTLLLYGNGALTVDHIAPLFAQAEGFLGHLPRHRLAEASIK